MVPHALCCSNMFVTSLSEAAQMPHYGIYSMRIKQVGQDMSFLLVIVRLSAVNDHIAAAPACRYVKQAVQAGLHESLCY